MLFNSIYKKIKILFTSLPMTAIIAICNASEVRCNYISTSAFTKLSRLLLLHGLGNIQAYPKISSGVYQLCGKDIQLNQL